MICDKRKLVLWWADDRMDRNDDTDDPFYYARPIKNMLTIL
jgi:hypothetical protein